MDRDLWPMIEGGSSIAAGSKAAFTPGVLSFKMVFVPGGLTFPTGTDDLGTPATVAKSYWIGETEVTYGLWTEVYNWAILNGYTFGNPGTMGDGSGDTDQHPVTEINSRDMIAWCNALTEYYNANNSAGADLECAYTYSGSVIRDSTDATACDNAVQNATATGFRLPISAEWECAARYRGNDPTNTVPGYSNPYYTKGNSASGATADYTNSMETSKVAWYLDTTTHVVGAAGSVTPTMPMTGNPNALGLYDMSGNVWEYCFDYEDATHRRTMGGGWVSSSVDLRMGFVSSDLPDHGDNNNGFRLARTD